MFKLRYLFSLPSFYLLGTFSIAYCLYLVKIVHWEQAPVELHFWSILTILAAILSVCSHANRYKSLINEDQFKIAVKKNYLNSNLKWLIWMLITIVGIAGIVKYIIDYSNFLGAFGVFYSIFLEDTSQLRTLADKVESVGTQLSYLSWISAFILVIEVASRNINKRWLVVVILIVLLNSIFLDRTRPVWIIFTCVLSYFIVRFDLYTRKKLVSFITAVMAFFIAIFISIGAFLGKGSGDENYLAFGLPKWLQPLFLYLTSSFAYLGRLIYNDAPCYYEPVRVTYPIQKILAKAHLVEQPPSQILEFFGLPLLTNVGTFLEPYFQDGGRLFMAIGILLHTFIFDQIVLYLLRRPSVFSIISIATLCFVNFIGFFVSKIPSTATWVILLICFLLAVFDSRGAYINKEIRK